LLLVVSAMVAIRNARKRHQFSNLRR
jgi:hypothetical protein